MVLFWDGPFVDPPLVVSLRLGIPNVPGYSKEVTLKIRSQIKSPVNNLIIKNYYSVLEDIRHIITYAIVLKYVLADSIKIIIIQPVQSSVILVPYPFNNTII